MRLAIVASHPVQYYAPLFRLLAQRLELKVFFAHRATKNDQAKAGFGVEFEWDVDLLSGYDQVFLDNVAKMPSLDRFNGCDTPHVKEALAVAQCDAVLILGWHLKAYVQALFAAKRLGLPLLVRGDSHLDTPRSTSKRMAKAVLYPPLLRLFDAALYVGERSRAYWKRYHYPEKRLFFSPHCVDTEWFAQRATLDARAQLRAKWGIGSDAKVALFAGKLLPFKRALDLVTAAAQMKKDGHPLQILIAGAGPQEAEIRAVAKAQDVPLHMLGFCNQTAMPSAYAAADVVVLPSEHETWGLVANEALACGRPIVLADTVGSAPDLAADRTVGRVFPCGDVGALAAALHQVFTTPPAPHAIMKKTREYSLDAAADGVQAALAATRRTRRFVFPIGAERRLP